MAYVKYTTFRSDLQHLVDNLLSESDPVVRLAYLEDALNDLQEIIRPLLYKAAYDARCSLRDENIAHGTGISQNRLRYLSGQHTARTGAVKPSRVREHPGLERAMELAALRDRAQGQPSRRRSTAPTAP